MALIREIPDTALADRFDGEPMVQSFSCVAARPQGRVWITTAEAMTVPGFGRAVGARRSWLRYARGARAFKRARGRRAAATPARPPLALAA